MPIIRVYENEKNKTKFFDLKFFNQADPLFSLKDIINTSDTGIQTGCIGNGACGLCLVKIIKGCTDSPEKIEILSIGEEKIKKGYRLACRVFPKNDLEIKIVNPLTKPKWISLVDRHDYLNRKNDIESLPMSIGLAIDVGTTFISISVLNCLSKNKELITILLGLNPQIKYGSDVISRLIFANKSSDSAQELFDLIVYRIKDAITDISKMIGITTKEITKIFIVGNTPMLTLLTKSNYSKLLKPEYWMSKIECDYSKKADFKKKWELQTETKIEIIPPIAGFIGSDLSAGIISTNLMSKDEVALLIDFGTNSEIALWDGQKLWVTSAACGPAFELSGVTCGMPALPGAIYRVVMDNDKKMIYNTISNVAPKGLCGSGLIDTIALLLKEKIINSKGSFTDPNVSCFELPGNQDFKIFKKDIDTVQRGKAAIAAGYTVLLEKAKCNFNNIKKLFIGGAFGNHLNIENAQSIGLLPKIDVDLIEIKNNTSLTGCEDLLLDDSKEEVLKQIENIANIINLSNYEKFEELYLKNLFLE